MQISRQERRAAERKTRKAEIKAQRNQTATTSSSTSPVPRLDELTDEGLRNLDLATFDAALDRYEAEAEERGRHYEELARQILAEREVITAAAPAPNSTATFCMNNGKHAPPETAQTLSTAPDPAPKRGKPRRAKTAFSTASTQSAASCPETTPPTGSTSSKV